MNPTYAVVEFARAPDAAHTLRADAVLDPRRFSPVSPAGCAKNIMQESFVQKEGALVDRPILKAAHCPAQQHVFLVRWGRTTFCSFPGSFVFYAVA